MICITMRARPDFDQLQGFLAVAEALNFRRAAERLGLDQSALSRRIKALEAKLGFPLLYRTTHAVRLTEAGDAFYRANREVMGALDAAVDRARSAARGASGRLTVGYMTFAAVDLMPEAARRFRAAYPEIALELRYQPTLAQKLSLARGEIDVALLLGPMDHADFATLSLSSAPLAAFVAAGHALARRKTVTLAEVAGEPAIVGTREAWDFYRERVDEAFALGGHALSVAFEAADVVGLVGLVRAGLGVTVLPATMRRFCPEGVVARDLDSAARLATLAAWRRPASAHVERFVAELRKAARDQPRVST
jgi:DNA-binding transcriptional LysR family regulator